MSRVQLAILAAGLAIAALGTVLLLEAEGTIELDGGWLGATVTALSGAALVASGISAREP